MTLTHHNIRQGRKWGNRPPLTEKEVPSAVPAIGNASGPGGLFSSAGLEKGIQSAVTMRRRTARPERRQRPIVTYKEGEGHTGAMIALMLSPEAASTVFNAAVTLFGDKADQEHESHITLAYLGKITTPGFEGRVPTLVAMVQRYTQAWLETLGIPMIGVLRGYKCFPDAKDPETGMIPVYREVDSPLLRFWVDGLWNVLDAAGVTTHRDYESYTPHVTVAYTYPEIAELLHITPAAAQPVQFANVTIALGEVHITLPLALNTYKANAAETAPTAVPKVGTKVKPKAPVLGGGGSLPPGVSRIKGNLCNVHGKFGPCDSATSEGFGKKPKKAKAGGGKGKGGGGKAKPTDEERQAKRDADKVTRLQEAEAQRVQNRTNALGAMASRPNDKAMEVLDTLAKGGQPDAAMLQSMEATGLVDKHTDGSYTLSSGGHSFLNALNKGDPAAANEAMAKGKDTIANRATQAEVRTQREADRNQAKADRTAAKLEREQKLAKRDEKRSRASVVRPERKRTRAERLTHADIQGIIARAKQR